MFLEGLALVDIGTDLSQTGLDACTLNNALNVAQLVALLALLKWVRGGQTPSTDSRSRG